MKTRNRNFKWFDLLKNVEGRDLNALCEAHIIRDVYGFKSINLQCQKENSSIGMLALSETNIHIQKQKKKTFDMEMKKNTETKC